MAVDHPTVLLDSRNQNARGERKLALPLSLVIVVLGLLLHTVEALRNLTTFVSELRSMIESEVLFGQLGWSTAVTLVGVVDGAWNLLLCPVLVVLVARQSRRGWAIGSAI